MKLIELNKHEFPIGFRGATRVLAGGDHLVALWLHAEFRGWGLYERAKGGQQRFTFVRELKEDWLAEPEVFEGRIKKVFTALDGVGV